MQCAKCGYTGSQVISTDLHERDNKRIRRRECLKCLSRYTTEEFIRTPKEPKDKGSKS